MPRVTDITVLKQMEQPTLTIRTRADVQSLPQLIGGSYAKLAQYLGELGEVMTDMPFVCYHNLDMQDLDVEIGFPVPGPLPAKDEMKPGIIPEGYVVFSVYRGPYEEMAPIYEEMARWVGDNGYQATGISYEYYFNGPGCPENELLTKIVFPVHKQ